MRKDAAPTEVLNRARRDVGLGTESVPVRGDDKSNAELKKEWEDHALPHAGGGLTAHVAIEMAEGTAFAALAPFAFAYEALSNLKDAYEHGDALKANGERGAMHLALVNSVDLPQGYRNVENARWQAAGKDFQSGAMKMATHLEFNDRKAAAVLQLHADRGMNAARDLVDAGRITRAGGQDETTRALATSPRVKAAYDADPAFRAGFDALVWAKQHDTAAYTDTLQQLEARDARYTASSISYRG